MSETGLALARLAAPLRGLSRAGWTALGLGAAALALGLAAWIVRLGWVGTPGWVLAAWAAALVVAGIVVWRARRADRALRVPAVARRLEDGGAWRHGALTALLEASAAGTSPALLAVADRTTADEVGRRGPDALAPLAGDVRRQSLLGAATFALGVGLVLSAGPRSGPAAALWHPGRALRELVAPVTLAARDSVVDRGAHAELVVEAIGRREATLWLRSPGEGWRPVGLRLDSLGRGRHVVGPLTADLHARVTSGSRGSDTVHVRVRLPAFLGSLAVTAHYPRYLGLEPEPVPTTGDTLVLPEGTRLATTGEATAELAGAAWVFDGGRRALRAEGRGFSGDLVPARSGDYRLVLGIAGGGALAGDTVRLPIRLVPDSAPEVVVPVPGADTTAAPGVQLPVVVDVRDDHGLRSVVLETRRVRRDGRAEAPRRQALQLPPNRPDRAILTATLDLGALGLEPGDTLRYVAVAADDAPATHVGRSREYVVRLATAAELRAQQRSETEAIGRRIDSLAAESRAVGRRAEDLARERPTPNRTAGSNQREALSYEDAKRAETVAEDQQRLMEKAEAVQQALEELSRTAEAAGVQDSAFQRRLAEVREQLDRALTPELREKLARLQESLKNLDAEGTREAMQELAEAQRQLREALERSRELFRRAAMEGDLASLKEEAKELAERQAEWNERVRSADSASAAASERQLAAATDSLAAALERMAADAAEAKDAATRQRLDELGERAQQAAEAMRQASRAAQRGQRQQAQQQGRQAESRLAPLDDEIQRASEEMARRWRDEVMEALDQAMAETSRLAERQLGIQEQLRQGAQPQQVRGEQAAVSEGVQRLMDQVQGAQGRNALVPQQIGEALAQAQRQMERAMQSMSSAGGTSREAADRAGEAVDALNSASFQMLGARGSVSGSQSGSGLAEAMERMSQLAQQQGGLSRQAGGLLPMAGAGPAMQEMRMLAQRQRAVAAQLERLRAEGQISGAGAFADEARELARRLEAGRLDRGTVERQERLFRRMLDAGRTLQGQEEDDKKERESTTAKDGEVRLPPALRARLEEDAGRPRPPTWEELQALSPEERRLVLDYFRRLTERAR